MRDPYACPDCGETEGIGDAGGPRGEPQTLRCYSCGEEWCPYLSDRGIDEWAPDDDEIFDGAW